MLLLTVEHDTAVYFTRNCQFVSSSTEILAQIFLVGCYGVCLLGDYHTNISIIAL